MSTQRIVPMLSYENGVAAIEWLCKVFGFEEKTRWVDDAGRLSHGEIALGDELIMLASPDINYQSPKTHRKQCAAADKWYQSPYVINGILVMVDNIYDHFERSTKMGASILSELEEGGPGTRYRVEDLDGQRWMFMQK